MAIQPLPAHGTLNWDIPLNSILTQLGNQWVPSDNGWLAWSIDPSQSSTATINPTAGSVYMMAIPLRQAATVTNIIMSVVTPGATLTAGQNFAGLYNSSGTRVGVTADQSAVWTSVGAYVMPFTAPANLTAGMYYGAFVSNGTTRPQFGAEASSAAVMNTSLTAATYRSSIGATSQTTLPASITMASRTAASFSWFMALS